MNERTFTPLALSTNTNEKLSANIAERQFIKVFPVKRVRLHKILVLYVLVGVSERRQVKGVAVRSHTGVWEA
jgi:hypothetical protein